MNRQFTIYLVYIHVNKGYNKITKHINSYGPFRNNMMTCLLNPIFIDFFVYKIQVLLINMHILEYKIMFKKCKMTNRCQMTVQFIWTVMLREK